jgi:hypothetical protein
MESQKLSHRIFEHYLLRHVEYLEHFDTAPLDSEQGRFARNEARGVFGVICKTISFVRVLCQKRPMHQVDLPQSDNFYA